MHSSRVPSEIVESTLLAIVTSPAEHEVVMTFGKQARTITLQARGVDHLLVNEFLQQNIVDEIRIYEQTSDPTALRNLLAALLFDCEQAADVIEPEFISKLEKYAAAVTDGSKIFLELIPVYGASVLMLAATIEWSERMR